MHDVSLIMNTAMASYVKAATETVGLCVQKWKVFITDIRKDTYKNSTDIQYIL